MATVTFVEIDGKRVDITDLPRTHEARCDGCGEFVAVAEMATINLQIVTGGRPRPATFLEGHLEHVLAAVQLIIAALEREFDV